MYLTNSQSRAIEDEFRRAGIAYQIIGGVKFYDRKEIKDVLAYIKIIINDNDSVSFNRIINFPARGVGNTSLNKIHHFSNENSLSYFHLINKPDKLNIGAKQKKSLKDFHNFISLYKDRSEKEAGSIIIKDLLKDLKLKEYYENQRTSEGIESLNRTLVHFFQNCALNVDMAIKIGLISWIQ